MPETQELDREIKGLYPQMNEVSGVPEGGLLEARNCVLDRPGVLSKRRGFDRYGPTIDAHASAIFEYQNRLIIQDGETLKYDSDGSGAAWTPWDGQFRSPAPDCNIRSVEFGKNLYFSTHLGVQKNDTLTNEPVLSGIPAGLDIELTAKGSGGWFTQDSAISYRILWGREDANDRLLLGAPSYRQVIENESRAVTLTFDGANTTTVVDTDHGLNSGDTVAIVCSAETLYSAAAAIIDVVNSDTYTYSMTTDQDLGTEDAFSSVKYSSIAVTFSIPDGISVAKNDFYEIYRTVLNASGVPGLVYATNDEHLLVLKKKVTAAEISAKTVTISDDKLPIELGVSLYTNSNVETLAQQNTVAPHCKDLAFFKNYLWAANVKQPQLLEIRLNDLSNIVVGDSITVRVGETDYEYTFAAAESAADREFLLDSTGSTDAIKRRKTMKSLVRVINRSLTDTDLYAFYSSLEADPAGKVLLKGRRVEVPQFSVTASSATVGDSFEDVIPTSGTEIKSSDSEQINALQYSKADQPEAFPLVNQFLVGSDTSPIIRIVGLRDSLIVVKEDGVFRITGESATTFIVRDLDKTVKVTASESVVSLNNAVFCLSTQGVLRIDENGTQVVSWPVEREVVPVALYGGIASSCHAVGYESERKYILSVPGSSGERTASKQWVFNYLTKEWTTWDRPATASHVLKGADKLVMAHGSDKFIVMERKSSTTNPVMEDYMDETIATGYSAMGTTTDSDGNTVSTLALPVVGSQYKQGWTYPRELRPGYLLRVGTINGKLVNRSSKVMAVSVVEAGSEGSETYTATLTLRDNLGFAGVLLNVTLSLPIDSYVRWAPEDASVRTLTKQFTYAAVSFEKDTALAHELGFYSDVVPLTEWVNTVNITPPTGWGYGAWGTSPWGDAPIASTPVVSAVPRQHQRCKALSLIYRHRAANERFDLQSMSLIYRPYQGKLVRQPA